MLKIKKNAVSMKNEIINYFRKHNKPLPLNDNDIINSTYRSLAYSYNEALNELEKITKLKFDYIYIVGGSNRRILFKESYCIAN